jgi:hypothetical protein
MKLYLGITDGQPCPKLEVTAEETMPGANEMDEATWAKQREIYIYQGRELAKALRKSLPGMTMDVLLNELTCMKIAQLPKDIIDQIKAQIGGEITPITDTVKH